MVDRQKKCADLVASEWADRHDDLDRILKGTHDEHDGLSDYGLSIDWVEPGTFSDQNTGYLRYQFSWGGPSDELRFYADKTIEYWYLDWFDGASVNVSHDKVARAIREDLADCGMNVFDHDWEYPEDWGYEEEEEEENSDD